MAIFTKINSQDILNIEKNFNIGKIDNFTGIKKGIENTNYLIKTKNKKYILTIFEKRVQTKNLPFFMNLMSGLSKLKIKCPKPLKNKKGVYLFKIKNKFGCLVTFLKGTDKSELNNNDCYVIGKNVAKLHRASKRLNIYRKNTLSVKSLGDILKKIDKRINKLSKNLIVSMENEIFQIKNEWPTNLPRGIIHSDLFTDNIFFHRRKFNGFIDFYFSCNDFLAYELATGINALCFNKKNRSFIFDKKKSSNLIKGYESIRKLSKKEKKYFNILCKGSALRFLLTRAYDYLNTPKSAIITIKDPIEYFQKLNFHKKVSSFDDYLI